MALVLEDFRDWLLAFSTTTPASDPGPVGEEIDLHTLLGHFVALRQEVNLQTRAVRSQQEQSAEALGQLRSALETLRQAQAQVQTSHQAALEEGLRPLLKTLVDLYDSVALAGREMQRVQANVLPVLEEALPPPEPEEPPAPTPQPPAPPASTTPARGFWARWLAGSAAPPAEEVAPQLTEVARAVELARRQERQEARLERARQAREARERVGQALQSLVAGYNMGLQRVERGLRQHGLEPIATVGFPFDPERMEVLEVVSGSGRPSGEVVEEVRRGYLWHGRVFRYAQVRVTKG